jgi:hypothetical protein
VGTDGANSRSGLARRIGLSIAAVLLLVFVAVATFGLHVMKSQQATGPGASSVLGTSGPSPSSPPGWSVYSDSRYSTTNLVSGA